MGAFMAGLVVIAFIISATSVINQYMKYNRDDIEHWKYREIKTMLEDIRKEIRGE